MVTVVVQYVRSRKIMFAKVEVQLLPVFAAIMAHFKSILKPETKIPTIILLRSLIISNPLHYIWPSITAHLITASILVFPTQTEPL